ncbi:MAG TPA: hypothetical protein VEB59_05455, partial [Gemmatimonadales bacterium]|nr:hypothetical protein [Gemmatimonadales bacterium]
SRAKAGVPAELDGVVTRAMAADPAARYPDMGALAAALREARSARRPGRTGLVPAGVAVALAAGGLAAWLATRSAGAGVSKPAETIAVLPFNASGPGTEVLGEGMVDLLATNLEGVGGIRTVAPRLVLKRWGDDKAAGGLDRGLALGRELGAGSVVTGSAVSTGGRVRLAADLHAVATGERLGRAQVDGPADSVLPLVDRLSVTLLRDVWRSREPLPSLNIASLTTDSLAALRAYLQGERYYRMLALDSALAAYTQAVEVDSTFALAHFRRALVYGWTGGYGSKQSHDAAMAGFRFAGRLPPRPRRLLEGYRLFEQGSAAAIDSLRAYVAAYPDDTEGWFSYGEALFHLRDVAPRDPDTIMAAFDHVIATDSTLTPAVIHPLELSLGRRDSVRFRSYLTLFERSAAPAHINAHRVAAQVAWGPPPSDSALGAALQEVPYPVIHAAYSSYRDDAATSDSIIRRWERVTANLRSPGLSRMSQIARGFTLVGLGRLRESRLVADSIAAFAPGAAVGLLGYPVILGLTPGGTAGPRLDSLLTRDLAQIGSSRRSAYPGVIRLMLTGRPAEARALAERSMSMPDTTADSLRNAGLLRAAAGWARLAEGDTAAGVAQLRTGVAQAFSPTNGELTSFLRFQLALALAARAETREDGINRLRFGFQSSALYLVPLAELALGRAYEAAGKPDSAALAYGRFVRLWDKADPEVRNRADEAREALRRLTEEPRQ